MRYSQLAYKNIQIKFTKHSMNNYIKITGFSGSKTFIIQPVTQNLNTIRN